MTYPEYEAHVRSRRDYARIARKDRSGERQVTGHGHCWPGGEEEEEERGREGKGGGEDLGTDQGGCEKAPGLPGSQVAFVQKRFHKDIFPNPVLMLNFCPVAEGVPGDLQNVTREVLFLIDCSSTMSGPDLNKVKVRHNHRVPWGWGCCLGAWSLAALSGPRCHPRRLCWWP